MTRVLVIGVDATPVATLRDALEDAGATAARARDAAAALDVLDGSDYDCVVVGDLPEVDTDRIEDHLRAAGHALPVVLVGDADPPETAARAVELAEAARLDGTRDRRRRARSLLADVEAALRDCGDRPEVERTVCDRLAHSPLYRAAWIGRWDDEEGAIVPAAATGLEVGALAAVTADPEGTVAARVPVDWTPVVGTDDPHVTVAVPVVAAAPAGILQVYADRPEGLGAVERDVLAEVGAAAGAALVRADSSDDTQADGLEVLGETLAHELGNQLDAARVQLELARERDGGDHLARVETALERIAAVASDATALARGSVEAEPRPLPAAAEEAWAAVETTDGTLSVENGTVQADPELLRLLLENLFRNAIEHGTTSSPSTSVDGQSGEAATSRAGTDGALDVGDGGVTVRVGPLDDGFFVADDGPGIPPSEREAVFEWGYTTQSSSGAGLGIVSLVADRHGWSIELVEAEDGGARFEFRR